MSRCIVIAVNDKYVPILSVLLVSIMDNTDKENHYVIVILYTGLSVDNRVKISNILANSKFEVRFIDVSECLINYDFYTSGKKNQDYITSETYYRLLAPQLLPEYKTALYLDCDIIVQKGWDAIFNVNLDGILVAGVRDIWGNWECYERNSSLYKYRQDDLGIDNPINYFNAGVLLMNLEEFRKTFSAQKLLDIAVSKEWKKHDQDVLNMVCKGKIIFLEYKWNVIECPCKKAHELTPIDEHKDYNENLLEAKIIHFASRKPWLTKGVLNEDKFWCMAMGSPFSEIILTNFLEEQLTSGNCFEENVLKGIKKGKLGIRFITKCVKVWGKTHFFYKK